MSMGNPSKNGTLISRFPIKSMTILSTTGSNCLRIVLFSRQIWKMLNSIFSIIRPAIAKKTATFQSISYTKDRFSPATTSWGDFRKIPVKNIHQETGQHNNQIQRPHHMLLFPREGNNELVVRVREQKYAAK